MKRRRFILDLGSLPLLSLLGGSAIAGEEAVTSKVEKIIRSEEIKKGRFAESSDIVFVHTGGIFGIYPYAADFNRLLHI